MISVLMSYYRRPDHLRNTLESYRHHYSDMDIEVVVVEDTPDDGGKACGRVLSEGGIPYQHITVNRSDKTYRNPGVLCNKAAELAKYEVLHLTNPENMHMGPILSHCVDYIKPDNYLVYGCRSLRTLPSSFTSARACIEDMTYWEECDGWYQHSVIHNRLLHFATVISKDLYFSVGGFDPRFDDGVGYEDNDFIRRIKSKNIPVLTFDEPYAAHQVHERGHWNGDGSLVNQAVYRDIWGENAVKHWWD